LRELPPAGERPLRPGLRAGRGRPVELPDRPRRHPRIPGPVALEEEQRGDLGQSMHATLRGAGLWPGGPQDGSRRHRRRSALLSSISSASNRTTGKKDNAMRFLDDSLLPENQQPLVIQVAPYAPSFLPRDSDDIPVTMDEQVQKAVDCWNAGATV